MNTIIINNENVIFEDDITLGYPYPVNSNIMLTFGGLKGGEPKVQISDFFGKAI